MTEDTCAWPDCRRQGRRKGYRLCHRHGKDAEAAGRLAEFELPSDRTCEHCGGPVRAWKAKNAVTCSRACNHALWKSRNTERVRAERLRWYAENGPAIRDRAAAWYAANTERARANVQQWKAENPIRKRELDEVARIRRRHRVAVASEGAIDHEAVWDRDEGVCWICEEPVDPELSFPDPKSRSIDHVVPLATGGRHSMANVALAHLGCNCSRQDKMIGRFPRWWTEAVA